jgi:DNA-binding Lrp family transcriptional regulator
MTAAPSVGTNLMLAYILVETDTGMAAQVADRVAAVPGVTSAAGVTGPYDGVVRAEARDADELGMLVAKRIRPIEGVARTLTCPVVGSVEPARGAGDTGAATRRETYGPA